MPIAPSRLSPVELTAAKIVDRCDESVRTERWLQLQGGLGSLETLAEPCPAVACGSHVGDGSGPGGPCLGVPGRRFASPRLPEWRRLAVEIGSAEIAGELSTGLVAVAEAFGGTIPGDRRHESETIGLVAAKKAEEEARGGRRVAHGRRSGMGRRSRRTFRQGCELTPRGRATTRDPAKWKAAGEEGSSGRPEGGPECRRPTRWAQANAAGHRDDWPANRKRVSPVIPVGIRVRRVPPIPGPTTATTANRRGNSSVPPLTFPKLGW